MSSWILRTLLCVPAEENIIGKEDKIEKPSPIINKSVNARPKGPIKAPVRLVL